jgi:hypothetical protein
VSSGVIVTSTRGRWAVQRLDLDSFSMVMSPTLDFIRAIGVVAIIAFAFFQGSSRAASARSRHSVSLAIETFVPRAIARQSPSALNRKALGAVATTPALGERPGAPSGLRPSSFVLCNTPVEVQFAQPGVSIIRAAPQPEPLGDWQAVDD